MSASNFDVIVIGAGAAGLMCAATAGYRGRRVLVLDHANKAGKKILMSGGGRCNFTHLSTQPEHFQSDNPGFCISALKRYSAQDFVELVERHGVEYHHKTPGQLFCNDSSKEILRVLMTECDWAGCEIRLKTAVEGIQPLGDRGYRLVTSSGTVECESLVVATGGLSIPTLGATGFGYEVARQFGLCVLPTRAGLVPFTASGHWKDKFSALSGLATDVRVSYGQQTFTGPLLFTHRGLSGPSLLQISSFWEAGQPLEIDWLPGIRDLSEQLRQSRHDTPNLSIEAFLNDSLPKRLAKELPGWVDCEPEQALQHCRNDALDTLARELTQWHFKPSGTEGYRTAEVTLGGVDTRALSSRTMAVNDLPNLYFIGEVLDVTGQLGGYNFQWAWASGVAAGSAC